MRNRKPRNPDYVVGKGRPPVATRWKSGQSGNPLGRPKGTKSLMTLLAEVLRQTLVVQERGGQRRITAREAVARQLVHQAMKGDRKAIAFLIENDFKISKSDTPTPTIPTNLSAHEAAKLYVSLMKQVRG